MGIDSCSALPTTAYEILGQLSYYLKIMVWLSKMLNIKHIAFVMLSALNITQIVFCNLFIKFGTPQYHRRI